MLKQAHPHDILSFFLRRRAMNIQTKHVFPSAVCAPWLFHIAPIKGLSLRKASFKSHVSTCFRVLAALRNRMWPHSYVSASRPSQGCPRFCEEVRRVKIHGLPSHYISRKARSSRWRCYCSCSAIQREKESCLDRAPDSGPCPFLFLRHPRHERVRVTNVR